ncbi:MAG: hypothetical protein ACFFBD_29415 [Candidatus Hodarchaeota archaeon]
MNPLIAFPYKNMKKIIELISQGEISVSPIQKATGMCSLDSTEVSDMLCHLTSFGQVKKIEGKWIIEKTEYKGEYGRFRKRFLKDAIGILEGLSAVPRSIGEIANDIDKPHEIIELYLPFLEEITKLGSISRVAKKFRAAWYVLSQN